MEDDMTNPKAIQDAKPGRRPSNPKRTQKSAVGHLDTHIGKELRQLYASILEEPIPDRFLDLIQSFEDQTSEIKKDDDKTGGGS